MINKTLKRIAIILAISVFSIVGIVACGGADITGSSYSSDNIGEDNGNGGDNGNGDNGGGETPNPDDNYTLPNDNPSDYYRIRVPFGVGGDGYTNVSYKDTNKLKQLWFDQINRKAVNDGKVFAIRNKANNRDASGFQKRHTHGNYSAQDYYYFNENGDIVWKEDNTVIKKLVGAIITEYRDVNIQRGRKYGFYNNLKAIVNISWSQKGIYTVGGVYANTMTTEEARAKYLLGVDINQNGQEARWAGPNQATVGDDPFKEGVFDFITYRHNVETYHDGWNCANNLFERQYIYPGFIEVLVMYDYDNAGYKGAATVHSYYAYYGIYNYWQEYANHPGIYFTPENIPYMTNQNIYLSQRPMYTTKELNHTAVFTDTYRNWEYLFMPGTKDVSQIGRKTRVVKRITRRF